MSYLLFYFFLRNPFSLRSAQSGGLPRVAAGLGVGGDGKGLEKEIFFQELFWGGRKTELSDTGEAKECDLMAVFQNISESALDKKYGIMLSEKKKKSESHSIV